MPAAAANQIAGNQKNITRHAQKNMLLIFFEREMNVSGFVIFCESAWSRNKKITTKNLLVYFYSKQVKINTAT